MKISGRIILMFSLSLTVSGTSFSSGGKFHFDVKSAVDSRSIPSGCSVITISKGDKVFFGGNDDYINPDQWYFVEKGDSSKFGVIWIGRPDDPQQGVNEKGLAYDANGLPRFEVNPHTERIPVSGGYYHNYLMQIMHECSTVKEVIGWANKHQRFPYMHDQMHFADKNGDAVIISAGKDGEMVFTRKPGGDGFLVSTKFNVANPSNGVMYLYYFYQYDDPAIINIKEELANPREAGPLSRLFPANVQQEAAKRYSEVTKTIRMNNVIGRSWAALLIISLVLLFILPDSRKGLRFWIPAVIVFGPFALIAKYIALRQGKISQVRTALTETVGDLVPVSLAYVVAQVILVLKTVSGGVSEQTQVLIIFGLPLFAAWIIFHSPLLASAGKKNFLKFLFQRLPQVLVVTFLGLAGIFPVAMPLESMSLAMSQIIPLSPWIVLTWWAITVLGSLAGGLFIFIYENWAVKRGYQAWNVFAGNDGDVITPGLSKLWWWVIISVLIIFAGLIVGVMLLKAMKG